MGDYIKILATDLGVPVWAFLLIIIWSGVWKLLALWKSARKNSIPWFIVLGIINTIGILEILYIFIFSKMKFSKKKTQRKKSK